MPWFQYKTYNAVYVLNQWICGGPKITIRDGGSTALYTTYTVDTVYTIQNALHSLNSDMYAYILREG